jgi:hypothetical protein
MTRLVGFWIVSMVVTTVVYLGAEWVRELLRDDDNAE